MTLIGATLIITMMWIQCGDLILLVQRWADWMLLQFCQLIILCILPRSWFIFFLRYVLQDFDSENKDDYFFGSGNLNPVRTSSPKSDTYPSQSPFVFADSVASTPHSTYGGEVSGGGFFDQSSRFDSFSVRDESSPRKDAFSRFDSMKSTSDYGHSRSFASFDDNDPFGSTGPFKVSSSETPRNDSKDWNNF